MLDDVTVAAPTEERLADSRDIDRMSTLQMLQVINAQDALVAGAVAPVLPDLAALVDETARRVQGGGTVHYFGAGTSGRLAVLDAAELLPTFNAPDDLFVAHHAGGSDAFVRAKENVEDSEELGGEAAQVVGEQDVAIGLTASGRTPFVAGALRRARERGAVTGLVTSHPQAPLAELADFVLAADTGPEVITGSTRLKAGTAQKLILNAFSTAVMVRLGRTWSNLMVDLVATNAKLRGRLVRILQEATGMDEDQAREQLSAADGELKPALLASLARVDVATARALLADHDSVATALARVNGSSGRKHSDALLHQPTPDDRSVVTTEGT